MSGPRDLLSRSPVFEQLDPLHLDALAEHCRIERVPAGAPIFQEGTPADRLYLLVEGTIQLSIQSQSEPAPRHEAPLQHPIEVILHPGRLIGWSAMVEPYLYRATATSLTPSQLMILDRLFVEDYCRTHPEFGVAFTRQLLSVLGSRLRAVRIRLVASRYEEEAVAIQALLDHNAEMLSVSSPLHKLPYYLRNRLTLGDAFQVLEAIQEHGAESERTVAILCLDILAAVRREMQLYQDLQRIYDHVAAAPENVDAVEIRRRCCIDFVHLFDRMDSVIQGEEHLPDRPGYIVVMNHLKNHPENTLPNDFQLTLDTHFVSSMILFRKHKEAPARVIRKSRPDEFRHQAYYDRLGYLYVYRGHLDTDEADTDEAPHEPAERRKAFLDAGRRVLSSGTTLVICPEGTSLATEDSPTTFRSGAFRLAAHVRPEPLIVPIAVANFDKKITRTRLAAVIHPPFRLSEQIDGPLDHDNLRRFLDAYQDTFRGYVAQAVALARS